MPSTRTSQRARQSRPNVEAGRDHIDTGRKAML
jgi:hypothetical protein